MRAKFLRIAIRQGGRGIERKIFTDEAGREDGEEFLDTFSHRVGGSVTVG